MQAGINGQAPPACSREASASSPAWAQASSVPALRAWLPCFAGLGAGFFFAGAVSRTGLRLGGRLGRSLGSRPSSQPACAAQPCQPSLGAAGLLRCRCGLRRFAPASRERLGLPVVGCRLYFGLRRRLGKPAQASVSFEPAGLAAGAGFAGFGRGHSRCSLLRAWYARFLLAALVRAGRLLPRLRHPRPLLRPRRLDSSPSVALRESQIDLFVVAANVVEIVVLRQPRLHPRRRRRSVL